MAINEIKSQFNRGHIAVIAVAVLILGGLTAIQHKDSLAAWLHDDTAAAAEGSGLYYAYQAPAVPNVLGADTIPDGPSVINEDGTVSVISDFGDVLGSNTDTPNVDVNSINVKTGSGISLRDYLDATFIIESAIRPGDFETALVSHDAGYSDSQVKLLQQVKTQLQDLTIPAAAATLHKLKIAQYETAIDLLRNFYQADSNPEYVTQKLTQFIDMQKLQDIETQTLFKNNPEL